jgi:hypothetical protein
MSDRAVAPAQAIVPPATGLWRKAATHPLATVFVLALLVRLINVALLRGNDSFFAENDTLVYWRLGSGLAKADTFWPTLTAMTDRLPLFPLLLAGVQATMGEAPRAVAIIQAIIDAGTCALIAALGTMVSPRVGLVAGVLAACAVTLIVFSSQMATETLFLFFFTAMLVAGGHFLRRPTNGLALLSGLAGGLSLATRPAVGILLVAAIPLVFTVALVARRGAARALAMALLFTVGAAAPISPALVRNAVHYGTFSLTAQTGEHLLFWIVPLVTERFDGTPYQTSVDRLRARYEQRMAERGLTAESNPFELAAIKTQIAKEELARLPPAAFAKAWLEGMVVNLGSPALLDDPRVRALPKPSFYNTPGAGLWEKARRYLFDDPGRFQFLLVAGLLAMVPFLLLEAVGFVMLARMMPWAAVFAAGIVGYFLMVNGPVASPKYRLPMEPILIVLSAIPLARLIDGCAQRSRSTAASANVSSM